MKKKIIIELTYNQSLRIYHGEQFLKVTRNHVPYYINNYSGKYVAQDWSGKVYDNVEVIGYF